MDASMDSLSIEIESTTKDSVNAIDTLIRKLDALRLSLQSVVKEGSNFAQLTKNLQSVSKSVNTKASSSKSTATTTPKPSFETQLTNLGITKSLDDPGFAKLKKEVESVNGSMKAYQLANGDVVRVTKKTKNGLEDVTVSLTKNKEKWNSLGNVFGSLKAKMAALVLGLSQLAKKATSAIKESANYQEALNLFMVTMGNNAEDAYKWVEKFSNALYLDPSSVMQYMGSFNSLTKGLGLGADKAYIMSKNLTQLTYDLASFKNLDFDTAFRKLQSAISGEIEPLRNVGVALSQATLQQLAYSLSIEKNVADMTEAEKAQLRYIQIMKSSTEWQTDMGRTLMSPANALRIIQQEFIQLARAIGNVFIPILMAAIPYIMVITKALTSLAQKLANLLGFQLTDVDYGNISSGLGDIASGIGDVGDSAAKTAKKLNTMLAPFDELNVVQSEANKNGGGSGSDVGAGGLDLPLPEYDALANLSDKFKDKMGEAEANLKKILPLVEAIGIAFAGWKIFKGTMDFLSLFAPGGSINTGMKVLSDLVGKLGLTLPQLGIVMAAVAVGIGVGAKSTGILNDAFEELDENGTSLEETFSKLSLGKKLLMIYSFINPISRIMNAITIIKRLISDIGKGKGLGEIFSSWFPTASEALGNITTAVGDFFNGLFNTVGEFFNTIGEFFGNVWNTLVETFGPIIEWVDQNIIAPLVIVFNTFIDTISTIFNTIVGVVTKIFSTVWNVVSNIVSNIIEIAIGIGTAVGTVVTTIGNIVGKFMEILYNLIKPIVTFVYNNIIRPIVDFITSFISNTIGAVGSFISGIINNFAAIVTFIKINVIDPITTFFSGLFDTVIGIFSDIAVAVSDTISGTFKSILNGAFSIVEGLVNGFITALNAAIWVINLIPGVDIDELDPIEIPRFAEGGFVDEGQLFIAREQGAEMVGSIGNKAAVANNDQITTSITNALITALDNYDFGAGKGPTTIYIGDRKVYEGYGDYVNSENDRYGTNTIRV